MISPRLVFCTLVILLVAASAHSQNVPTTSGAMLTINGTVNGINVNIVIYDSQIHSGVVQADACDPAGYVTDAHALQGGSLTGCDNGDAYEVTDNNPVVGAHQSPGVKDITKSAGQLAGSVTLPGAGFHIETHYCINGSACNAAGVVNVEGFGWCNSSKTICANPDTGFLAVTNNTGYTFTGTITLQGNSPITQDQSAFCAPAGMAVDLWTTGLTIAGGGQQSVTLALGAGGMANSPDLVDSSNCGGFNFDQQGTLAVLNEQGQTVEKTATFQANNDDFIVQCLTCAAGDTATWRPEPVPQSLFAIAAGSTVGSGQTCITFADFSSPNAAQPHGMCPLFLTHCLNGGATCGDAETFFWRGTYDYIIDENTIPNPIGGVHFLGDPGAPNCMPSLTYSSDSGLSYTGAQPGVDPIPPQHSGSGGGLNCFVTTYDPTAAAIPIGVTEFALGGPFSPITPLPGITTVAIPSALPIKVFLADGAGGPGLANVAVCTDGPIVPGSSQCADLGVKPPWLTLTREPLTCPKAAAAAAAVVESDSLTTVSGLHPTPNMPVGNYTYVWQITKNEVPNTCASVNIVTSAGAAEVPFFNVIFVASH